MIKFNKFNICNLIGATALVVSSLVHSAPAYARDPACAGTDQSVCDMLGTLIIAKGRGCHRMMSVSPLGNDGWRVNCVVSSSSSSRVTYTLQFSADRTSYTLH